MANHPTNNGLFTKPMHAFQATALRPDACAAPCAFPTYLHDTKCTALPHGPPQFCALLPEQAAQPEVRPSAVAAAMSLPTRHSLPAAEGRTQPHLSMLPHAMLGWHAWQAARGEHAEAAAHTLSITACHLATWSNATGRPLAAFRLAGCTTRASVTSSTEAWRGHLAGTHAHVWGGQQPRLTVLHSKHCVAVDERQAVAVVHRVHGRNHCAQHAKAARRGGQAGRHASAGSRNRRACTRVHAEKARAGAC